MILILIILILPTNVALQLYIQHQNQKQNSEEIFWQLEQLIRNNIYDLEREKRDFSQKCIQSAKMAAYFVEHNPGYITDLEHTKELAEKLDVDEIHLLILRGDLCGYPSQVLWFYIPGWRTDAVFLSMLEDTSLELCREITPNTAEGKMMEYAAVWMEDKSGIVQIGMEPKRLLKQMEEKKPEKGGF